MSTEPGLGSVSETNEATDVVGGPDAAELVAPVAARPRFCHRCGTPWDIEGDFCPSCVAAGASTAVDSHAPGAGQSIVGGLALYFVFLAISLSLMLMEDTGPETLLIFDVVVAVPVLIWAIVARSAVGPLLSRFGKPADYVVAAGLSVVTFITATLMTRVGVDVLGIPEILVARPLLDAGYGWGVAVLSACIQPAIIEEVAFRGVILASLRTVLSTRDAVIVSAMMFMIIHLAFASFPHLLLIGLVLGWLRVRTGSLYPCMLLHFLHNLFCILTER